MSKNVAHTLLEAAIVTLLVWLSCETIDVYVFPDRDIIFNAIISFVCGVGYIVLVFRKYWNELDWWVK